ncbi:MAG: hypothetical protein AAGF11_35035 [Myxococcota bacterium]
MSNPSADTGDRAELTDEQAARFIDAVCLRHAELGLRRIGPRTMVFAVADAQVEIAVEEPVDAPVDTPTDRVFARHAMLSLRHRLGGSLDDDDAVRRGLAQIADTLPALAAMMLGGEISPEQALDPVSLLPCAVAARRAWLEHRRAPHIPGLPPCLDLELRPVEAIVPLTEAVAPPSPCNDCSHAMWCPANAAPAVAPRQGLRPLRHREPTAAVLAALRSIYEAWGVAPSEAVTTWVHEAVAVRRGELSGPVFPFELSLKREHDRLAPLVRVVDMHPPMPPSWSTQEARCARRRRWLRESARALNDGPTARAVDDFMDWVEGHQEPTSWISYGIEGSVHGGRPRTQIYAHAPHDADASLAFVRAALDWAGAPRAFIARLLAFCESRVIALVAHAPVAEDPRRIKLYVGASLSTREPDIGLEPVAPPVYAPSHGLAVLRCGVDGPRWEKWDFRCMAHFQRFGPVLEDFVAGVRAQDVTRIRRILDGQDFAPWPTWVSMRPSARTIYFNPR